MPLWNIFRFHLISVSDSRVNRHARGAAGHSMPHRTCVFEAVASGHARETADDSSVARASTAHAPEQCVEGAIGVLVFDWNWN